MKVRTHVWNKEDAILTLYFTKFGVKKLGMKDEKELAEHVIGSSKDSLLMQSANIRYLLGEEGFTLSDTSKDQVEVVEQYCKYDETKLREVVENIISNRDVEGNIRITKERQVQKRKKVLKDQSQKDLEETFRRMGLDPSKMKKVS